MKTKATLRAQAKRRRASLGSAERAAAAAVIAERVVDVIAPLGPKVVALYWPIGYECDTQNLMEKVAASGAAIGLPAVVDGEDMVFRRFAPRDDLINGSFGTSEPRHDSPALQPDIIVLPVVAFDRRGGRLGYGRGYYDRAISAMRDAGRQPHLLGIAFSEQEVETIPTEPHDARLDWLITEKETLAFRMR